MVNTQVAQHPYRVMNLTLAVSPYSIQSQAPRVPSEVRRTHFALSMEPMFGVRGLSAKQAQWLRLNTCESINNVLIDIIIR